MPAVGGRQEIATTTIPAVFLDAYGTLFDVQIVAAATEAAVTGHGDYITQVWRLEQLEGERDRLDGLY